MFWKFQPHVILSGRYDGVINGSQHNGEWEAHELISEAMERLLSKRFLCKARLGRLTNELQDATFETQLWKHQSI